MSKRLMILVMIAGGVTLWAQSFSLRGKILDQTGALIPGVTVTVQHRDSGREWKTVSNPEGIFVMTGIASGIVEVTAELPGFKTSRVTMRIGDSPLVEISITLAVASVSENVEVS